MQLFGRRGRNRIPNGILCCCVRARVKIKAVLALAGDLFECGMPATGNASSLFM